MLAALVVALALQDTPPAVAPPAAAEAAAAATAPAPAPLVLASHIAEVVVHRTLARVTRTAEVPAGGRFAIEGLPGLVNPDSVRVRLSEGAVLGVEVHKRQARTVPDDELAALRKKYEVLSAEKRLLTDEQGLRVAARDHFSKLLGVEQGAHLHEMAGGRPDPASWEQNLKYVLAGIETEQGQLREVEAKLALVEVRHKGAYDDLAKALGSQVELLDVVVDVQAPPGARLDVEYVIAKAGWSPIYELRTSNDATSIDFVYRARLTQMTGEDWTDCPLVLSTASPERGAKGLEPRPTKARIAEQEGSTASRSTAASGDPAAAEPFAAPADDGNGITADPLTDRTAVEAQGLSVQFRLPEKQTILSRMEASTVLIGERRLSAAPEHVVVPAVDTTVWLRGRTQNSTPWVMLPGAAAVYFGEDFIGTARFNDPVMPGQGFTVHLGADPGLSCERVQTSDVHEEPTFLSQRQAQLRAFRITLENNGGHPCREDGSVAVIVRQAIPVPADDRIRVEVVSESRPPAEDERWKKDLAELGLRTWVVDVPRSGRTDLLVEVRTSWPDDLGMRVDAAW
jgi:uncharacterized protein (TIGR02231 family)